MTPATGKGSGAVAVPPWDGRRKLLKAALHTHTTTSDGKLSPEELVAAYAAKGFDVVALTDHGRLNDTESFARRGPLVVSGMELHPPAPCCGDRYHLVAIDIHEETDHSRYCANDLIAWANARGAVVFSCHPYWCGRNSHDLMLLEGTIGTEVCNYGCEIEIGRGISRVHWDEILERKGQAFGLAVDDSHSAEQVGGGWVMLSCEKRTPAAVKKALREGRFYSSMGPEIRSMRVLPAEPVKDKPARRIEVACSPAEHVVFYGPRWRGRAFHGSPGRLLTSAAFTWTDEQYIRVEVLDERGRAAWTNALFLSPDSPGGWRI